MLKGEPGGATADAVMGCLLGVLNRWVVWAT